MRSCTPDSEPHSSRWTSLDRCRTRGDRPAVAGSNESHGLTTSGGHTQELASRHTPRDHPSPVHRDRLGRALRPLPPGGPCACRPPGGARSFPDDGALPSALAQPDRRAAGRGDAYGAPTRDTSIAVGIELDHSSAPAPLRSRRPRRSRAERRAARTLRPPARAPGSPVRTARARTRRQRLDRERTSRSAARLAGGGRSPCRCGVRDRPQVLAANFHG